MIRLLLRASLVGLVTGIALTQFETTHHLVAWEFLLVAVAILEMRELPARVSVKDPPLFTLLSKAPRRLPRAISSTEMMVMDAVSGRVTPDIRLRASLRQIATHRLHRRGIDMESPAAVEAIGAEQWSWLMAPAPEPTNLALVERLVSGLEEG